MSIDKRQRILLEEASEAAPPAPAAAPRRELEPLAADPDAPADAGAVDAPAATPLLRHRIALGGGLALGAVLILLHTLHALAMLLRESPARGLAWSAVFVLVAGGAGRALWRLWRRLRAARVQEALGERARELLAHDGLCEGRALCEQIAAASGQSGSPPFLRWQRQLADTHNDREVLALYGRTVLAEADARALAKVSGHAGDVAVMVAVSYFPAVDMLLVLWRQLKLVEDVAAAYGVDPGYWGRIRLLRKVLRNMALAGAAEVATEVGVEVLGAGVMARLSGAAAQGVAAGVLTARLGLRAMEACRAIPWDEDARPRLRQVTQGVLATAKRYLMADSSAS
jgi:putative membrane protein